MNKLDELIKQHEEALERAKEYLQETLVKFKECLKLDHTLLDGEIALFTDIIRFQELIEDEEYIINELKELKVELNNDKML